MQVDEAARGIRERSRIDSCIAAIAENTDIRTSDPRARWCERNTQCCAAAGSDGPDTGR